MREVYRIGVAAKTIRLEKWSSWDAFDASSPGPTTMPSDLAYALLPAAMKETWGGTGFEIQRIRVNNGCAITARALIEGDIAVLQRLGGELIGLFEVVHGHDVPALLLILKWGDATKAVAAQNAIEACADVQGRRRADRLALGRASIRGTSRIIDCTLSVL